jgi:hypothetical protein
VKVTLTLTLDDAARTTDVAVAGYLCQAANALIQGGDGTLRDWDGQRIGSFVLQREDGRPGDRSGIPAQRAHQGRRHG